jgi:hypothetical protein|tara:strand:- start:8431 stop:8904 length:474 start_codon:yes stop_codon:yes gene_type:complete
VITVFLPSLSFANDTIAGQICNAYKDEDDRIKCFDELTEVPRYISFKFGVSACPKVKYWEEFIDELDSGNKPKVRSLDEYCFSLREGNIVYGFLNRAYYSGRELVQVKASSGILLWLESEAVKDIVVSQSKKPALWHTVLRNQDGKIINDGIKIKEK